MEGLGHILVNWNEKNNTQKENIKIRLNKQSSKMLENNERRNNLSLHKLT